MREGSMFGFGKKYCPICGKTATDSTFTRFGKHFCSEEHQDMYVEAEKERQVRNEVAQGGEPRRSCGG